MVTDLFSLDGVKETTTQLLIKVTKESFLVCVEHQKYAPLANFDLVFLDEQSVFWLIFRLTLQV